MVKVLAIGILQKVGSSSRTLAFEKDVSSFGYFQRSSVAEFLTFTAKTIADRTALDTRQSVEEKEYVFHIQSRPDGLCGVVACDSDYPWRVAFSLIGKVLDEFTSKYPESTWTDNPEDTPFAALSGHLQKYQDPNEADTMSKIYKDLDDTKEVLHKNLESLLDRGEKLDDLVKASDELSLSSKMFYKQAKKTNSCCIIS